VHKTYQVQSGLNHNGAWKLKQRVFRKYYSLDEGFPTFL